MRVLRVTLAMATGFCVITAGPGRAGMTHVFSQDDPVQGLAGIKVGQVIQASLAGGGRVVALVSLSGPGVTSSNRYALVTASPGAPVQLMARTGNPVSGAGLPAGTTIVELNNSSPLESSDDGVVARRMLITIPGVGLARAILAGDPGSMAIQIYQDQAIPALGGTVTNCCRSNRDHRSSCG